ncbi:Aste57867_6946 [Aphanomyces stellatus]|uniref:Aste57867_6946 protein n=1 Tax=Aphanomyces stellatus TaxID=120398 RepID=A0A485KHY8_9STRA|nr:hypothetical protein As57867_006924 [Aphanomyces stellatus]VFT83898.1 Aste57867_6946 [Aphanomyces stellatus]
MSLRLIVAWLSAAAAMTSAVYPPLPADPSLFEHYNIPQPHSKNISRPHPVDHSTFEEGVLGEVGCHDGQILVPVDLGANAGGSFCVDAKFYCNANLTTGPCPSVQEGLPYGSYCTVNDKGLLGCRALVAGQVVTTHADTSNPSSSSKQQGSGHSSSGNVTAGSGNKDDEDGMFDCGDGRTLIFVQGAPADIVFCIDANFYCRDDLPQGPCPSVQTGLPRGSYCTSAPPNGKPACVARP